MAPTLQTLGLTNSEAKRLFHAFNCVDKDGSGQVRLYNRRATVLCGEHGLYTLLQWCVAPGGPA